MTDLELPEPEMHAVRLDPYKRTVLGANETVESQIGRLVVGEPILIPLNAQTVDADTMPFLQARPDSRFHHLSLTVTFTPDDDLPLKSAWVNTSLTCGEPATAAEPIAWSMLPHSVADVVPVTRKVTLSPSLKLSVPGVTIDASTGLTTERQETFDRRDVSIEALYEATSHPQWSFYSTNSGQIRGIHTLCLVIDIPAAAHGTASIEMGATVRMHRMKVFRFTAALAETPGIKRIEIRPD
jgi:hypothetical protein